MLLGLDRMDSRAGVYTSPECVQKRTRNAHFIGTRGPRLEACSRQFLHPEQLSELEAPVPP